MVQNRRDFLKTTLSALASLSIGGKTVADPKAFQLGEFQGVSSKGTLEDAAFHFGSLSTDASAVRDADYLRQVTFKRKLLLQMCEPENVETVLAHPDEALAWYK